MSKKQHVFKLKSGLTSNNLVRSESAARTETMNSKKEHTVIRCSEAIAGFNSSITGAAQQWQLECVNTPDKSTSLYPTS